MSKNNLSALQKFIWIDQQLSPQSPKYNIGGYAIIKEALDAHLFQKAISIFSKKHPVFCSLFKEEQGIPFLFINNNKNNGIHYFENNNIKEVQKLIQEDFSIPFEVNKNEQLFTIWLIKIDASTFIWYTKLHHLIADGFSFQILFNEVGTIYTSLKKEDSSIEDTTTNKSFANYVQEENAYYNAATFTKDKAFWKEKYQSFPQLIFSTAHKNDQLYVKELILSPNAYGSLQQLAQQENCSMFHLLLASFSIVFSKFYHTQEINIGTPLFNRTNRIDRTIFGPFINLLPLPIHLNENASFLQLIQQIKKDTFSIYRHQKFQQAEIIKAINYKGNRLYDFRISYENFDYQTTFSDGDAEIVALSNHSEDDPLSVHIMDYNQDDLKFRFDFNGSYIPEYIADELITSIQYVLEQTTQHLHQTINQLSILAPKQKKEVERISRGNQLEILHKSFPELWNKNLTSFNSNKALRYKDDTLSYEQTHQLVQKIAAYLQTQKIRKGDRIGVLMDRSIHYIPVVLGILQVGATYVPIDKCFPTDRIKFIVEDSTIKLVLTDEQLSINCQQAIVNSIFEKEYASPVKAIPILENDDAYIIYTSGSTGKPKGVLISHASLIDYATSFSDYFKLDETDVVMQQSSFVFDTSIEEIFPILSVGGSLVISENPKDFHHLLKECSQYQVSLLSTNPYVVQYLNDHFANYDLSLKTLISGGDKLKRTQIHQLLDQINVYNTYGPTESTVCATYHKVDTIEDNIPIGHPIANRQVYVINNNQLLPKGAIGEIALGGKGLAKEYINNPNLTKALFVDINGTKVYKTGDLGQWNKHGDLLFHGRKDNQLSFRGYRIEAQEIEKTIKSIHPTIKNCFVTVREIQANPTLLAYVVENGTPVQTDALMGSLKQKLPNYMIPNHILVLDEIPLNTSGKINTKLLPLPQKTVVQHSITPPSTKLEKELLNLWQNLLNTDEIGINSNFFELGGHSLLANQFIGLIREQKQQDISLKAFYDAPTIHEIASLLQNSESSASFQLQKAPEQVLYPLSFPQERLWFLNELNKKNKAYYVPRAIKMTGKVDVQLIEKTFTLLIEKHEILRTQFPVIEGIPYQRVIAPFYFHVPLVSLEHYPPDEQQGAIEEFILKEGNLKFDLEKDPLVRVSILRKSELDNILVFCEHHIIHDGWTQGILLREFIDTYEKLLADKNYTLSKPYLQFKDFAYWQRNYFTKEILEKHAKFWREKLAHHKAVLPLPTKGNRPKEISGNGRLLEFTLEDEFAQAVRNFSQQHNATLFITMLAAFKMVLSYFSKETDICIGTAAANRRLASVSNILGMIINTIAVRTEFSSEDTLLDIFSKVRESCFETYAYEDTPFDKVVQFTGAERDLSINPIFQYNFSFMNTPSRNLHLPDLDLEILDSHNQTSKFDINVVVVTPLEQNQQESIQEDSIERIIVEWEYNSDIFTEELMELMITAYNTFLRLIVTKGNTPFEAVHPFKKETTFSKLDVNSARTTTHENVLSLFHKQVAKNPHKQALVFEETHYTYQELEELSSQFALFLSEHKDIQKNDIIAIYLERSAWQIISILAILKLGAAYLPINRQTPEKRRTLILQDSKALFCIDTQQLNLFLKKQSTYNANTLKAAKIDPEDLVYVIYTSGSTGDSKGVKINHKNLYFSTTARKDIYQQNLNFLLLSSISFDSSIAGIFYSLCYGNTLHLTSNLDLKDPNLLANYILKEEIGSFLSIPSYAELILTSLKQYPKALKEVIVAGEYCSPNFIHYFFKEDKLKDVALFNEYGPTECTVWATYHQYERGQAIKDTIGQAISGVQTYVLDANHNFLPNGIIGELGIAGETVSTGYLNNDTLTQEKFITKTLANNQKIRIYTTGDLVIKHANGTITYKGRKDHQVKIRGHRIELQEIEKVLNQYPQVDRAVVGTYKGNSSELKLRAYYEASNEIAPSDLKEHIGAVLPLYMVPSSFFQIDQFKTNENGKIDRNALQKIKIKLEKSPLFQPNKKRSPLEQELVLKWQELLETTHFDIDDDFFELGGTSIQAIYGTKLSTIEFPVKYYFQYRTIRAIAKQINTDQSTHKKELLIPLLEQPNSTINLILVPYAGALEASYYSLLNGFKNNETYNIYEVASYREYINDNQWDLDQFLTDFRTAIANLPADRQLVLYGHCAGTALSLLLAQELQKQQHELLGVFLGASLFTTKTNTPFDANQIKKLLLGINENLQLLPAKEQQSIIDNFGIDHKIALQIKQAFTTNHQAIPALSCPIHCLFGEHDPLTPNHQEAYSNWSRFTNTTLTYTTISEGNHYFVNEKSETSANIIIHKINDWNATNK